MDLYVHSLVTFLLINMGLLPTVKNVVTITQYVCEVKDNNDQVDVDYTNSLLNAFITMLL